MKEISLSTSYSTEKNAVSFAQVKQWVKTGEIFKHLFRYDQATLQAYDLQLIPKPFALALLVQLLSRNKSVLIDQKGVAKEVSVSLLLKLFCNLLKDFFSKNRFLKQICQKIKELEETDFQKNKLRISGRPVYLRTDMLFGLGSGGSVGHIAGVLNHLQNPIFLTSDLIPTVNPEVEIHRIIPQNGFPDFKELPALHYNQVFYNEAERLIRDQTISFFYQRYSLHNFAGIQLANEHRVPLVLEYNGSEIWVSRHWASPLKRGEIANRIESLCLLRADLIVVVSTALKNELVSRGISPSKILVNPNGVDPERYQPMNGQDTKDRYHLEGKLVLGFIGTFGKWHGAEVLAEAFRRLLTKFPSYRECVRLLFIGNGPTMPQVKEILSQHEEYCVFTGTIPQAQGPAHLASCDILISPHIPNPDGTPFFGSPTKLFEYMAMGKGIVASDLDQIAEILKHDETAFLTKPADPDSLMMGLKALIDDEPKRIRLGKAARKEVVLKYTWKAHTQKIMDKLKELSL
jgi:glycosyltransferase involved in cell wall biosynthesis